MLATTFLMVPNVDSPHPRFPLILPDNKELRPNTPTFIQWTYAIDVFVWFILSIYSRIYVSVIVFNLLSDKWLYCKRDVVCPVLDVEWCNVSYLIILIHPTLATLLCLQLESATQTLPRVCNSSHTICNLHKGLPRRSSGYYHCLNGMCHPRPRIIRWSFNELREIIKNIISSHNEIQPVGIVHSLTLAPRPRCICIGIVRCWMGVGSLAI